jgi:hypothetical protein
VRASFALVLPSGELLFDGQAYPANTLTVRPCSVQRLAPFLPTGPVEPEELLRYLGGQRVATPALLERAVRIPPERREEALELLSAAALDMTRPELERALPALRWLSGQRHLGADVDAWRRWREQRRALAEADRPLLPLPRPADRARASSRRRRPGAARGPRARAGSGRRWRR